LENSIDQEENKFTGVAIVVFKS